MIFIYVLLGIIVVFWLIKQTIVEIGILTKITVALFVIVIGTFLMKWITGYVVFSVLAKFCACIAILLLIVNVIRKMFTDD